MRIEYHPALAGELVVVKHERRHPAYGVTRR